jgi:hypothetical protein
MKTIFLRIFIIAILSIELVSCGNSSDPNELSQASRTVLVYMVANNNLGSDGRDTSDINEMLEAAASGGLHNGRLIVYHVPYNQSPILKEITANGVKILKTYDTTQSSVSAARMKQVIADTKALAPANDYGIVLWSHATGWLQDGIIEDATVSTQSMSTDIIAPTAYGRDNGLQMNITTLASVLEGEEFSFVYCDCCYMASVEVAYELRHATKYFVGSVTELPANGMLYELNVPLLLQDGEPDLIGAARNTYEHYRQVELDRDYTNEEYPTVCTMSVIATAGLDELAAATRSIYESGAVLSSDYTPQAFELGSNCHYYDLGNYIHAHEASSELLTQWDDALSNVILYKANTAMIWNRVTIRSHCGLSTYPLTASTSASTYGYSDLQWYNDVAKYQL